MNLRCCFGHKYPDRDVGTKSHEPFVCDRCGKTSKQCTNCGRYHNPVMIVICTVTR